MPSASLANTLLNSAKPHEAIESKHGSEDFISVLSTLFGRHPNTPQESTNPREVPTVAEPPAKLPDELLSGECELIEAFNPELNDGKKSEIDETTSIAVDEKDKEQPKREPTGENELPIQTGGPYQVVEGVRSIQTGGPCESAEAVNRIQAEEHLARLAPTEPGSLTAERTKMDLVGSDGMGMGPANPEVKSTTEQTSLANTFEIGQAVESPPTHIRQRKERDGSEHAVQRPQTSSESVQEPNSFVQQKNAHKTSSQGWLYEQGPRPASNSTDFLSNDETQPDFSVEVSSTIPQGSPQNVESSQRGKWVFAEDLAQDLAVEQIVIRQPSVVEQVKPAIQETIPATTVESPGDTVGDEPLLGDGQAESGKKPMAFESLTEINQTDDTSAMSPHVETNGRERLKADTEQLTIHEPNVQTDRSATVPESPNSAAKESQTVLDLNEPEEIVPKVAEKMQSVISTERSEVRIQLKPEHLGELKIKISVEQGVISAEFVAESQVVKEVIQANFPQLRSTLQQQGLDVSQLLVNVGTENPSSERRAPEGQQGRWKASNRRAAQKTVENTATEAVQTNQGWKLTQVDLRA